MNPVSPGELEVSGGFSLHLGPRYDAAGLKIQFHYNQVPGLHLKTEVPLEYQEWILKGITDGLTERFPNFPSHGSVWVTEVMVHQVYSSQRTFYLAARMAIDQAFALTMLRANLKAQL